MDAPYKKRLLHVVLWLGYGGLEKIVLDVSKELNKNKYEVYVVALEKGGVICEQLRHADIPVTVLGRRPGKIDCRLLAQLIKLIRKLNIDIIHSHSGCIMYSALAGRLAGVKKIIHTDHGRYLPDRPGKIWEDRIFSRLIDKYVCVSEPLAHYMLSFIKVPKKKLTTIINGVDTSTYRRYSKGDIIKLRKEHNLPPDAIVLGTVCRLTRPKNVGFLIDWMKTNYNLYRNLFLIVVGHGPKFDEWFHEARDIPGTRVRFLGSRNDVVDLLNIFDIFTLVSITEGTSLTVLEAMATQLPVIASDVGGNNDIVDHGKTGFLFDCNNIATFGEYLDTIITNPHLAWEMGRRARECVKKNYSFDSMINRYAAIYNA